MRPLHALLPVSAAPFTRRHAALLAANVGLPSSRTSSTRSCIVSLFALLALIVVSSASHAHAQARETLLLASDAPEADTLATALAVELASAGWRVLRGPAPRGETLLERAGDAQRNARVLGARSALFVESATGGGAAVHVVEADGDATRSAPLPSALATLDARTFAAVASSLVEELESPPQRLRVRVQVAIDAEDGSSFVVDDARVEVRTNDGSVTSASSADPNASSADPNASNDSPESAIVEAPEAPVIVEVPVEATPSTEEATTEAPSADPEVQPLGVVPVEEEVVPSFPFAVDFAPFVGMGSFARARGRRSFSLGVLGTYAHSLEGFGAAGGLHVLRGDQDGVVVSGLVSWTGGDVDGAQIAGQVAVTHGDLEGAQISGSLNVLGGALEGAQVTGGLNLAFGNVHGLQLAPANYSHRDLRGAQVGVANVTRGHVNGVQVGLFNYAKKADLQIGLINVMPEGRTHVQLTATSEGFGFATLVHGGDHWHWLYSVGGRPFGSDSESAWAAGLGFGLHITPTERLFVDVDLLNYYVSDGDHGDEGTEMLTQLRAMLGVRLHRRFALIGGITYNVHAAYDDDTSYALKGRTTLYEELVPLEGGGSEPANPGWRVEGYPGITLGVQFF